MTKIRSDFGDAEDARKMLLQHGIDSMKGRAGFVPATTDSPIPQTYEEFRKSKGSAHSLQAISQWLSRGTNMGTQNPKVMEMAAKMERLRLILTEKHPVAKLMRYPWYREALEYLGIEKYEDAADTEEQP